MRKPFAHPQGRQPVRWRWSRSIAFATFSLAAVGPLHADNTNLTDEVRLLREENALLQQQVKQNRNIARTRKNWAKVELYLTKVEKADGCAKAWALREQFEQGQVRLEELAPR